MREQRQGVQQSVPLFQCKTVQGSLLGTLGTAIPLITVELAKLPPHWITRVVTFCLGIISIVIRRRKHSDHPPVRGVIFEEREGDNGTKP